MAKQLLFDDRARLKLQRGVETLAKAVAVTMGPTGRNVIIDKSFGNPVVTKDGVTVSKEVELEDLGPCWLWRCGCNCYKRICSTVKACCSGPSGA